MEQSVSQAATQDSQILERIEVISGNMNGWLKFLGIINIISGALTALSVVGIVIAWLPIWLGVLLLQAGTRITNAKLTNNRHELVTMMDKLRLYFVIQGILFIVFIAITIISFILFGSFLSQIMNTGFPQY